MNPQSRHQLAALIRGALAEDLGRAGDITSAALFDAKKTGRAAIISKSAGVLSGVQILKPLFGRLSRSLSVNVLLKNGATLSPGGRICELAGPVRAILAGERVALNFLQHLSGVATAASTLARLISHTKARLLDTRKTLPLLRALEKQAVVHGGGFNHRFGLFDMVLVKDTHVKAAGGVGPAVREAQAFVKKRKRALAIEVETQSVAEFMEALSLRPQRIMLDNMSVADMATCAILRDSSAQVVELEASGNVSADTIVKIAETGVDFISAGSITHSAPALDIHLVIE
ncbi:MAG TPA: carboxylating nicotinate-nucleotide diphosphorylase [Chitinivibrionales bacterium]|nr:carboxylating nicotinate-nucleotide diphosphorylase [Chitinivibrionales bacterium]